MAALASGTLGCFHTLSDTKQPIHQPTVITKKIPMPPRPRSASGGHAFARSLRALDRDAREAAVTQEILRGNFPEHLRKFVSVRIPFRDPHTRKWGTAILEVMPDYLAVGSDQDFVTMPMTPDSAQKIADRFGCILPTPTIVDAIYRSAALRLRPKTFAPGPTMVNVDTFVKHNDTLDPQRRVRRRGTLVAGHKKDVVLTARLTAQPDRVAIYGWHRSAGRPIQPLSLVHGKTYADYSHGIRLIRQTVVVNNRPMHIQDVFRDAGLARIVTTDGGRTPLRYPGVPRIAIGPSERPTNELAQGPDQS